MINKKASKIVVFLITFGLIAPVAGGAVSADRKGS